MNAVYLSGDSASARWLQKLWPEATFDICYTVPAAKKAMAAREHDCVLVDWNASDSGALAIIRYIRAVKMSIPVIAVSPEDGPTRQDALSAGADAFVLRTCRSRSPR